MKPTAAPAAASSSKSTSHSARGSGSPGGTIRYGPRTAADASSARTRGRRARSPNGGSRSSLEPPPDHEAAADERDRGDQPGHEPLRDRSDPANAPAAGVVRMLCPLDVG